MKIESHNLNFEIRIYHSVVFMGFLLLELLGGCGGTARIPAEKPVTTSQKTPELVSVEPENNATTVKRNASVVLNFSEPMDALTLTVNSGNTQCSGTIQISSNSFSNCVRMNPPELKDGDKKVVLSPKGIYATQKFHQIRLTTEIKTVSGTSLNKRITTNPGFRTTWSQQIGTPGADTGFALAVDPDGNVYLAGNTSTSESRDESDLFLAKYAASGFQNWIQQPGFGRSVTAAVLQLKKSGQLRLSGYSQEDDSSAVILASYDLSGKKIFSKTITLTGRASGKGMAMDPEGNIYIPAEVPFNLMKIRKTGEQIWSNELSSGLRLQALAADTEFSLYLTGSIEQSLDGNKSKGGADIFLLKMYQMGPKRWSRTFGTPLDESGTALALQSDKAIAIVGYVTQVENGSEDKREYHDAFVIKYDSEGKQQWSYVIKGTKTEQSTVALWTPQGNLLVGGYTESSLETQSHSGKEDAFLAKLDSGGELLWLRQFGTKENERPLGIALGTEGQIYVTGFTEAQMDGAKYSGGRDVFLVQFNKDGEKQ